MALAKEALRELPPKREAHEGPREGAARGWSARTLENLEPAPSSTPCGSATGWLQSSWSEGEGQGRLAQVTSGLSAFAAAALPPLPAWQGPAAPTRLESLSCAGPGSRAPPRPGTNSVLSFPKPVNQGVAQKRGIRVPTHRVAERKRLLVSVGAGIRVALAFGPENQRVNLKLLAVRVGARFRALS